MTEESITTIEMTPPTKLHNVGHWCWDAFMTLAHFVGVLLSIVGLGALVVLWGYVDQQRTQLHGHYEYWLYQQVCPTTMGNAEKEPPHDGKVGTPKAPYFGSSRFYEACVAEAKK